jgi:hypothetical protein
MGTYNVVVTRCESSTIQVEAESASVAELLAQQEAEELWEAETINVQVDQVTEVVSA